MLALIGGPPRCGKTQLALRLSKNGVFPFVSVDLLWSVLEVAKPEWRKPMAKSVNRIPEAADLFRPYLDAAAAACARLYPQSILEGELIRPADVPRLALLVGDVRAVFLVRTRVTATELKSPAAVSSWLASKSDEVIGEVTKEIRAYSAQVQRECGQLGLHVVDVSGDFEEAMTTAAMLLVNQR